ncbi:hypothetical protein [Natrononativus amylolyticus]|uniref:hypothetical protein n=1 Tax=Natrononativus amylolyticus TaxID=2963434 RepID=UPI0020CD0782|nr:hypothetical protein [Natrononativus amylolyticus]
MFDSTFHLLSTHPVTIPAFAFALWVGYRGVRRSWFVVAVLAKLLAVLVLVPVFTSLFLAAFTDHWFWDRLADAVISAASSAVVLFIELVDALFAAWLELVLLVTDGVWSSARHSVDQSVPELSGAGFVLAVFGFQFIAGAALLLVARRAATEGNANGWLLSSGAVLFVSGLFAALIGFETWHLSQSVLAWGLVAATLGLTLGILSTIVLVRPDFGGESMLPELGDRLVVSNGSDVEDTKR